ncbi:prepilin peptidase [Paenibacillus agricola]|uniref:Prepilin peptidase n=1 Tax=Paenibacillus agricola TaxID=2716264 RepID=A0ABX0JEJ9_9BACL|nr:A24 family peptidase [Paenibacillus agricola]NHN34874.1 prepilin peptidase [Paenibacillus agricola]
MEKIVHVLLVLTLLIVIYTDLRWRIIPNNLLLVITPIALILRLISQPFAIGNYLLGALIGFGVLFLAAYMSNGKIGGGDIKFYGVIGLILGVEMTLLSLVFFSLLLCLYYLVLYVLKRFMMDHSVPLAPFIAASVLIVYSL